MNEKGEVKIGRVIGWTDGYGKRLMYVGGAGKDTTAGEGETAVIMAEWKRDED